MQTISLYPSSAAIRAFALLTMLAHTTVAQSGKYGVYNGTIKVSGTEKVRDIKRAVYAATIQIAIPVDDGSKSSAMLEISDVGTPSAKVTVTQYELDGRNSEPDADGKITSWKCSLAAPVTVPVIAQGVVNLNYSQKTHSTYVSVVTTAPIPLNCVDSRGSRYKKSDPMNFFFGTNEPSVIPYKELPMPDPARISAKFTLVPRNEMKDSYLPQTQEWEFILKK